MFPARFVASDFQWSVATIVVDSISCASDSHCFTWLIAFLLSVFVNFLHNHKVWQGKWNDFEGKGFDERWILKLQEGKEL